MDDKVTTLDLEEVIKIIDDIIKISSIRGIEERIKIKGILLESDLAKTGKLSMGDEKLVVKEIQNWKSYPSCERDEVWNIWDKCKKEIKKLAKSRKVAST